MRIAILFILSLSLNAANPKLHYNLDSSSNYALTYDTAHKAIYPCIEVVFGDSLDIIDSIDFGLTFTLFSSYSSCAQYMTEKNLTYSPDNRDSVLVKNPYIEFINYDGSFSFYWIGGDTIDVSQGVAVEFNHFNIGKNIYLIEKQ